MSKRTLSDVTAEKIKMYIKEHQLEVGDKLPNEYDLSQLLVVSRNTVREAVKLLASRNILTIKQGAGTFVSEQMGMLDDPLGLTFMQDKRQLVKDLIEIRMMIEPEIAALAAQNATTAEIEKLQSLTIAVENAIESSENFSVEDSAFHSHLAVCSKNKVIGKLMPVINEGVDLFASSVDNQETKQTRISHRAIYEAVKNRKPVEAKQAMLYHLLYNKNRF